MSSLKNDNLLTLGNISSVMILNEIPCFSNSLSGSDTQVAPASVGLTVFGILCCVPCCLWWVQRLSSIVTHCVWHSSTANVIPLYSCWGLRKLLFLCCVPDAVAPLYLLSSECLTPRHWECQEKKMPGWHHQWIWALWQPLIIGRCVLTSGYGKFNSTTGLDLVSFERLSLSLVQWGARDLLSFNFPINRS